MTREGFCHISFCKFIDFRKKDFFMEQEPIARTALDEMVESDQDQMLKAMIPYLPSSGQRFLSVYTKVRELRNTMSLFQSAVEQPICRLPVFPAPILWKCCRISVSAVAEKIAVRSIISPVLWLRSRCFRS